MYKLIKRIYIRLLNFFFVKEEGIFWPTLLEFLLPVQVVVSIGIWQAVRLPGMKWWLPVGYMVMFFVAYVVLHIITSKKLVYSESIIYRLAKSLLLIPLNKHLSWFTMKELYSMNCYPEKVMKVQEKLAALAINDDTKEFWWLYDVINILLSEKERSFLFPGGKERNVIERYKLLARYIKFFAKRGTKFNYSHKIDKRFEGFLGTLGQYLYDCVKAIRIKAKDSLQPKNKEGVPIDEYSKKELAVLLEPAIDYRDSIEKAIRGAATDSLYYHYNKVFTMGIFAPITPFEGSAR